MNLSDTWVFIKFKKDYLTDSGMSRGKKTASNPGPYTTLRSVRQDLNQLASNPSKISPTANMLQMMAFPKDLFFTPIVSIAESV